MVASQSVSKTKEKIINEAKRIEADAYFCVKGHSVSTRLWRGSHLWLGVLTVVLSSIAGAFAFSDGDNLRMIGYLSIAVAVLSGLMTFLNPNDRATLNLHAENNYESLRSLIRIFWLIECGKEKSEEVLMQKLISFTEQRDKIGADAPQIPWLACRIAKANIAREKAKGEFPIA